MQNDFNINKNIEDFVFEVIENIDGSKIELFRREQFYIDKYNAYNSGYNCCEYSVNPKYTGNRITNICSKPTNIPRYVTIPREIIYDKDLGDKRVIVYSYLCSRRALDDSVAFSINELVKWTGLIPNYHDGKINHKYFDYLELLSHYGYFESCPNFIKLKTTKGNADYYYKMQLNIEKFDTPEDGFGIIYFDELERIINFKKELENKDIDTSRLSAAYILLLLAYIRVNIRKNTDQPQCCYRLYKTISDDIGLSERYITRIVEILDVMNIIKFAECKRGRYQKNGEYKFVTTSKIFADYRRFIKDNYGNVVLDNEYDYKSEIEKQIVILKEDSS